MSHDPPGTSDADATDLRGLALDRRGRERVRAVLNVLTEATFFYREDNPDLFFFLRRNQAAVRELFENYFGWRLYVDRQCARLIKDRLYNDAVRPTQRALFDLRRRDECLLFALLLEFHEEESQRQGLTDEDRNLRFLLADFVTFAIRRCREELQDTAPSEVRILEATRPLFEQLERHRFLRLVDRKNAEAGEELPAGMGEHLLYEFLPGIRCYDPSLAARSVVLRTYRSNQPEETGDAGAQTSSTDDSESK